MNLPKLRKGHTYRIYDAGKWSLILDTGYGASNGPVVAVVCRSKRFGIKRVDVRVRIRWATATRYRKYGAMHVYKIQAKVIHALFFIH